MILSKRLIQTKIFHFLKSDHPCLALLSGLFPLFASLNNINPRHDSLNKFDNVLFFARHFNVENQFPIWTTLNFGSLASLENLLFRPEEAFSVILSRTMGLNSMISITYVIVYLANLVMNYSFASICKDLGINDRRLVFALILILDFVAFPFTQYWLHYLVIFYTVIIFRIYLSLGMYSFRSNVILLVPMSFILWGGYPMILPGIALFPTMFLGLLRRSEQKSKLLPPLKGIVFLGLIMCALLNALNFFTFSALFFKENTVNAVGRSSGGSSTLTSYLSAAGSGSNKYLELLGAPTVWQDTHLVISPIFMPFFVSFMFIQFRHLPKKRKQDFLLLVLTCFWTILLTLPFAKLSTLLYSIIPILSLARNPGFHMGILIPLFLLLLGLMFSRYTNQNAVKLSTRQVTRTRKEVRSHLQRDMETDSRKFDLRNARVHFWTWIIIAFVSTFNFIPYPLAWTRIFLGNLFSPLVLLLLIILGILLHNNQPRFFSPKQRSSIERTAFSLRLKLLFTFLSTILIFGLGIFQMYFLSFVDYRSVREMHSAKVESFQDANAIQRSAIKQQISSRVSNWDSLSQDLQETLISELRLKNLGYEASPIWMKLIDTSRSAKYRVRSFDEFSSKTFIDGVLHESTPNTLTNPTVSLRSNLRNSEEFTTNLVSTSAYGLNQDYCPALGAVMNLSKYLSRGVIQALNSGDGSRINDDCSRSKIQFLNEFGASADFWVNYSSLSVGNGSAQINFKVDDEYIGKDLTLVYKDSYSPYWHAKVNQRHQSISKSVEGFKQVTLKLDRSSNSLTFELDAWLKFLANSRLLVDPILYLGMIYYLLRQIRQKE
jgi:hypothetical protein